VKDNLDTICENLRVTVNEMPTDIFTNEDISNY